MLGWCVVYPSPRPPPWTLPGEFSRSDSKSGEEESAMLTDVDGRDGSKLSSPPATTLEVETLNAKG